MFAKHANVIVSSLFIGLVGILFCAYFIPSIVQIYTICYFVYLFSVIAIILKK